MIPIFLLIELLTNSKIQPPMNWNRKQLFIVGFVVLNVALAIIYVIMSFATLSKRPSFLLNPSDNSTYSYLRQLLEDSETRRQIVEQQLTKVNQISKSKIVTIDTPDLHHYTRRLIGSIHKHHEDMIIAVYGLNLNIQQESEVRLWANVEFVDIVSTFLVTEKLKVQYLYLYITDYEQDGISQHEMNPNYWKPVVMLHATEKYGRALFIDASYIVVGKLDYIENHLTQYGSYYVSDDGQYGKFAPACSNDVMGYTHGSIAYNSILVPQTKCTSKKCSKFESKFLFAQADEIPEKFRKHLACIDTFPTYTVRKQQDGDSIVTCYIKFREDFLYSVAQLPNINRKPPQRNDGKIWIAIGFPSTSKGITNPTIESLPFIKVLLPSILMTIPKEFESKYKFKLYLGFDKGDQFYDNPEKAKELIDHVKFVTAGYPIEFEMIRCTYSYGWTTFLWNAVFQHAMNDGCDYFYQVNDDLQMRSMHWPDALVSALQNNPVRPNLGVSGPTDSNNRGIFTQAFVHRTHYEIFGFFYPPMFKNWYSDDWITHVYDDHKSTFRTNALVHNMQTVGTRYEVCSSSGKENLKNALASGRRLITEWLKDYN